MLVDNPSDGKICGACAARFKSFHQLFPDIGLQVRARNNRWTPTDGLKDAPSFVYDALVSGSFLSETQAASSANEAYQREGVYAE